MLRLKLMMIRRILRRRLRQVKLLLKQKLLPKKLPVKLQLRPLKNLKNHLPRKKILKVILILASNHILFTQIQSMLILLIILTL
jgi:hypothetical protein